MPCQHRADAPQKPVPFPTPGSSLEGMYSSGLYAKLIRTSRGGGGLAQQTRMVSPMQVPRTSGSLGPKLVSAYADSHMGQHGPSLHTSS